MNKSIAMKWVKALRSGKFKQGTGRLRNVNSNNSVGYCCLGVLGTICKVNIQELNVFSSLTRKMQELTSVKSSDGYISSNDDYIKIRVGNHYKYFNNLANANDNGASFRSIATWIEKNYKKL